MVEVARTIPSLTGVVGSGGFISALGTLVIAADVGKSELIGLAIVFLCREIHP